MFDDFLPFTSKIVEHSRYLPGDDDGRASPALRAYAPGSAAAGTLPGETAPLRLGQEIRGARTCAVSMIYSTLGNGRHREQAAPPSSREVWVVPSETVTGFSGRLARAAEYKAYILCISYSTETEKPTTQSIHSVL